MASPLQYNIEMGSYEAHLEVFRNRLNSAQSELQSAINEKKPEALIESLREEVEQAQMQLGEFTKQNPAE